MKLLVVLAAVAAVAFSQGFDLSMVERQINNLNRVPPMWRHMMARNVERIMTPDFLEEQGCFQNPDVAEKVKALIGKLKSVDAQGAATAEKALEQAMSMGAMEKELMSPQHVEEMKNLLKGIASGQAPDEKQMASLMEMGQEMMKLPPRAQAKLLLKKKMLMKSMGKDEQKAAMKLKGMMMEKMMGSMDEKTAAEMKQKMAEVQAEMGPLMEQMKAKMRSAAFQALDECMDKVMTPPAMGPGVQPPMPAGYYPGMPSMPMPSRKKRQMPMPGRMGMFNNHRMMGPGGDPVKDAARRALGYLLQVKEQCHEGMDMDGEGEMGPAPPLMPNNGAMPPPPSNNGMPPPPSPPAGAASGMPAGMPEGADPQIPPEMMEMVAGEMEGMTDEEKAEMMEKMAEKVEHMHMIEERVVCASRVANSPMGRAGLEALKQLWLDHPRETLHVGHCLMMKKMEHMKEMGMPVKAFGSSSSSSSEEEEETAPAAPTAA